ncbi:hypothetical protein [Schlesneria sp. T3-172]|uniref:hypothetical protein n=1 Tax=Schlesneria sphaerica TaxID=3373610 RepID=UPI0037C9B11F
MSLWRCVLELDSRRQRISGSTQGLLEAIDRAADLRIATEFLHNEHIDVHSASSERIREVAEFGVTYSIDHRWTAGIMHLRQPIELPAGFGPRPSMSFFVYNQDGTQGIARPYLDGQSRDGVRGSAPVFPTEQMPKYHAIDQWDAGTNAPSHNFIYDFDHFRYCVNDSWREVLYHSPTGEVLAGSLADLVDAFSTGCSIKLGIVGLCDDLHDDASAVLEHTVYVQGGSAYYYTDQKLMIIGTHPVVRVSPQIPLEYRSGNWDFGWVMLRSDGHVVYRRCDPYTLQFSDHVLRKGVRWFVR